MFMAEMHLEVFISKAVYTCMHVLDVASRMVAEDI